VRAWVLTRQVPLDQALEPGALAAAMDLEAPHVAHALVRLAGEHVVSRTADGRYLPIPLTIELADQLFGARCVIELGVADVAVGRIADDDIAVLDGCAQRLAAVGLLPRDQRTCRRCTRSSPRRPPSRSTTSRADASGSTW
jgi:DNA-binding GntR family transcriptional regulator